MLYILYFKDHAVFSLNATGAFSDGIIRAVTWDALTLYTSFAVAKMWPAARQA